MVTAEELKLKLVVAWQDVSSQQLFVPAVVGLAAVFFTVLLLSTLSKSKAAKKAAKAPKSPTGTVIKDGVRRSTRVHKPPVSDDFFSPITATKKTESKSAPLPPSSPSPKKRSTRSTASAAAVAAPAETAATPRRSTRRSSRLS